jgi:hypothetical protein
MATSNANLRQPQAPLAENFVGNAFSQLEALVSRREAEFGTAALLEFVAGVGARRVEQHVEQYRQIIRQHDWPNVALPDNSSAFCAGFVAASHAYVEVGFLALEHLARGGGYQHKLQALVLASEALRGQFGKQSPTGLDARLDSLVAELDHQVSGFGKALSEQDVNLLCIAPGAIPSAESLLLEDLLDLPERFGAIISTDEISASRPADLRRLLTFLRRHCRWSFARFRDLHNALQDSRLAQRVAAARWRRAQHRDQRREVLSRLRQIAGVDASAAIEALAGQIGVLNGINLSIEPVFSFKGCVGLPHGLILDRCRGDLDARLAEPETQKLKWWLLSANPQSLKEIIHA